MSANTARALDRQSRSARPPGERATGPRGDGIPSCAAKRDGPFGRAARAGGEARPGSAPPRARRTARTSAHPEIAGPRDDIGRAGSRGARRSGRRRVVPGVIETNPKPGASPSPVRSPDATLPPFRRAAMPAGAFRALKPGGRVVLAAPCRAGVPAGALRPLRNRHGPPRLCREAVQAPGFGVPAPAAMAAQPRRHCGRRRAGPGAAHDGRRAGGAPAGYRGRMMRGPGRRGEAADAAPLARGTQPSRMPE
ncbi:hypothetical protein LNKW23_07130 [Paralimibaculum aggregatum]|uniref:Uncharacterized protein n=1 Tax=Paralimibaculum aggregatum TaxID=3036245 RepID=A0ABQ6LGZ9_9RHOB|nr:hypothetical protein LNKW23_07130 [Limibaculum sp. NKW23]